MEEDQDNDLLNKVGMLLEGRPMDEAFDAIFNTMLHLVNMLPAGGAIEEVKALIITKLREVKGTPNPGDH